MMHLGLIGQQLSHSFSAAFFTKKFNTEGIHATYRNFEMEDLTELSKLIELGLHGFNVTIPFKEKIIQHLDYIDDFAKDIGAVNTVRIVDKKMLGYNTDVYGFTESIKTMIATDSARGMNALVFGSGGASKAVTYALSVLNIDCQIVSRTSSHLSYSNLTPEVLDQYKLLVNTTPLGMYPNVKNCIDIPFEHISNEHYLFDLIYNPEKTLFLAKGEAMGATIKNGVEMLVYQANKAWEIWNSID